MGKQTRAGRFRCRVCDRPFTSWIRLGHHWAAEHAPRTSEDILRTSRHVAKAKDLPRGHPGPRLAAGGTALGLGKVQHSLERGAAQ